MYSKNILMFVILAAAMLTALTATTMTMAAFAARNIKAKCEDNDNNNCNDSHKTQKIDQENKCKIENENEDHSKNNLNENELACVNFGANVKDFLFLRLPSTGTLLVTKGVKCPVESCQDPDKFTISVTGNNPTPSSFQGSTAGTEVTLGPGGYTVFESKIPVGFQPSYSGDCKDNLDGTASGNIIAGESQTCHVLNDFVD